MTLTDDARPRKILVADEDAGVRRLIARIFAPWNARILEAEDGERALELALRERPDVLLLDYDLPRMTGSEVAEELSRLPEFRGAAVAIVSDGPSPMPESAHPYDAWIVKPFSPWALAGEVLRIFADKASRR